MIFKGLLCYENGYRRVLQCMDTHCLELKILMKTEIIGRRDICIHLKGFYLPRLAHECTRMCQDLTYRPRTFCLQSSITSLNQPIFVQEEKKYLSSTTAQRGDLSYQGDKGYYSDHLSLGHLAPVPPDIGLKAQSITYWMGLWDKCCKMRYGYCNVISGSQCGAQLHTSRLSVLHSL